MRIPARFQLRSLMVLLAVGLPLLAAAYFTGPRIVQAIRTQQAASRPPRPLPPPLKINSNFAQAIDNSAKSFLQHVPSRTTAQRPPKTETTILPPGA